MSFLSRFRHPRSGFTTEPSLNQAPPEPEPEAPEPEPEAVSVVPALPAGIACPSCARLVEPAPPRTRRCPHCRRWIIVRRTEGRTVYLTEAAVEVFEAERRREADMATWTARRADWLRLARGVGAAGERIRRIAARAVSAEAVAEAKALYVAAATRTIKATAKARNWDTSSRYGRELATALFLDAGSPVPPPDDVRDIHATALTAALRGLEGTGTHAEMVGAGCCAACREDDGRAFAIKEELRTRRLPHAGCTHGLCACEWWVGGTPPKRRRRKAAARPGTQR